MMNKNFHKSTKEDIIQMLNLKKKGFSFSEIGHRLHKDHTTIMYWVNKIGPNNIFPVENLSPENVIINMYKKEKEEKPKNINFNNVCKICHLKKKNKKWCKTDYCCLACWEKSYGKPI